MIYFSKRALHTIINSLTIVFQLPLEAHHKWIGALD